MSKRLCEQPCCILCGRFISWIDMQTAVAHNFTAVADYEPREDMFAHRKCDVKAKLETLRRQAKAQVDTYFEGITP